MARDNARVIVKPFVCGECRKRCYTPGGLKQHIESRHGPGFKEERPSRVEYPLPA